MKLKLTVPGMMCPLGWADEFSLEVRPDLEIGGGAIHWCTLSLEQVRVSHPVHLMLIEGAAPVWMFMGARARGLGELNEIDLQGPFLLLHTNWPALHVVPYHLDNVVFGVPNSLPKGVKLTTLVPAMVSALPNHIHSVLDVQRTSSEEA
jgi:hypothetical protein